MVTERKLQHFWVPSKNADIVFSVCSSLGVPMKPHGYPLSIVFGFRTYDFAAYEIFKSLNWKG